MKTKFIEASDATRESSPSVDSSRKIGHAVLN